MKNRNEITNIVVRGTKETKSNQIDDELLNFALQEHIIDISYVRDMARMTTREEILQKHTYKIWQGETNRKWCTYLPDATKPRGKALKKICSREKLEDIIVEYWIQKEKDEIE